MADYDLIPARMLITRLPEENEGDVVRTIEMVERLDRFRGFIVLLFSCLWVELRDREWFI